ncbi:MAG: protein kinase [Bryobacterales bacterium]|nr:protein kinase [Bryobacterales bacterium]
MDTPSKVRARYEIREVLGKGGMGVVYRAFDVLMKREVALKTIHEVQDPATLDLFFKEWGALASIVHPNIVEIYDIGEVAGEKQPRPYFVMPLLPGTTLDKLIKEQSHRLTIERSVDIICQVCRGLQVAHERGLVHRDMKPSNIFVMADDSVKIIDFGIAHIARDAAETGLKGTLAYMAPEQIQMKPPSPASDIFSLGVTVYETLTRRRPFQGASENELASAILTQIPPPVSDLNPGASVLLSQVIHKAMAKQPWHRYASAREFADTLQKALRNQAIEFFDQEKLQPRIEKAQQALDTGELQFANEVLSELEAEGHLETSIGLMRRQVDHALRQTTIRQLLESARRYFEAHEFSLAMRKIQEALQLDPNDADTLALRSQIERERRELKVDEWSKLARQHLENCAFGQARLALQHLVEMKPDDVQARQLAAEIDRREKEFDRLNEERDRLQKAALQAWDHGEVSSALNKLDRVAELNRQAPPRDTGRLSSFETFYQRVRTEHDALQNAYEAARTHLATDNLDAALKLCDQFLAKFPNHTLFQALRYDVEERRRQRLSALIAEVDRRVEAEADLDKRLSILEEALAQAPGETHFERALRLVRDKRDLVNSIAAKARYLEEQGQLSEALDQWKTLGAIHAPYPALDFEIQQLTRKREQQVRAGAKADWVEQADRQLEQGLHAAALDLARQALAEFPGDPELEALAQRCEDGVRSDAEAGVLVAQGQERLAAGEFDEGVNLIGRAYELNPRNPATRTLLVEALVHKAREIADTDWKNAGLLVEQVLELEPANALARSIRGVVAGHERDEAVSALAAQARRLQTAGDAAGALAVVEQGLAAYPNESRLTQIQATLQREAGNAARLRRERALEDLRAMREEAAAAGDAKKQELAARAREIGTSYEGDAEVRSAAAAVLRAVLPPAPHPGPPPAAAVPVTPQPQGGPPPPAPAAAPVPTKAPPPAAAVKRAAPPPPAAPASVTRPGIAWNSRTAVIGVGAGAAVLLLMAAGVMLLRKQDGSGFSAGAVAIRTTPPGAVLTIDGQERGLSDLRLDLPPGEYPVTAALDGFLPASGTIRVEAGQPAELSLTLDPRPAILRLYADLERAEYTLDGAPVGPPVDGELVLDSLPPGVHELRVAGGGAMLAVPFEVTAGGAPRLAGAVETRNASALVAGTFRGEVHLTCPECGDALVEVNGVPSGTLAGGGALISSVSPGAHELAVGVGDSARRVVLEMGPSPALNVYLHSSRPVGTLVVVTGEDGATIFLNRYKVPRTTRAGRLRIPGLPATKYTVRVTKDGFAAAADQLVELQQGEETMLTFELRPLVQEATLEIAGAAPGTYVYVDGSLMGAVEAGQPFRVKVLAGDRAIELRRDEHAPRTIRRSFAAGETLRIAGDDARLDVVTATVRVRGLPAGGAVRFLPRGDEAGALRLRGESMALPPGVYVVVAEAKGFTDWSAPLEIKAGESRTLDIRMTAAAAPPREVKPAVGMDAWQDPKTWVREGPWFVRKGAEVVLFGPPRVSGSMIFTAYLRRGRRLQWMLHYRDRNNYALFQMDRTHFYWGNVTNGNFAEQKLAHGLTGDLNYTLRLDVAPGRVVTMVRRGDNWRPLHTWDQPGREFPVGRFGFLLADKEELAISNFAYYED